MTHKKVAVILSGCCVYDGAEIYESVITLLRLDQRGAKVQCFAPNIAQHHVINHLTGEEMPESRNVLVESAQSNLLARLFNFTPAEYFALAAPEEGQSPKLEF